MSYSDAIFYLDHVNGSDAVRATLSGVVFSNPSGTIVRGAYAGHGLVTGAIVTVSGTTNWNGAWKITKVDDNNFDLDGAVWTAGADNTGDVVPFGGSSWADAWKTITAGATAARIAAGDVVRIAKSPAPVSLGQNATFEACDAAKGGLPATANIRSSTNTSPISIQRDNHGYASGDIIHIVGHTTNYTANGTWVVTKTDNNNFTLNGSVGVGTGGATGTVQRINGACAVLTTAVTQGIDDCEGGWATPNSSTLTYPAGQNGQAIKIVKSSPGNNALCAYKTITSVDLSGYQALTFWIYLTTAISVTTSWKICLCDDAAGTSIRNTFLLPAIPAYNKWVPITIAPEGGGNLYNGVQSIALYSGSTGVSTSGITLDNFNAVTVPGLELRHLISKNSLAVGGTEGFIPLKAIIGKILIIDSPRGYYGSAGSANLYYRETIKLLAAEETTEAGSIGKLIQYLGGYNTSNSIADGETYLDSCNQYAVLTMKHAYTHFDRISPVRSSANGIDITASLVTGGDINDAVGNSVSGLRSAGAVVTINSLRRTNYNTQYGLRVDSGILTIGTIGQANSNYTYGIYLIGSLIVTEIGQTCNNNNMGIFTSAGWLNCSAITKISSNGGYGIQLKDVLRSRIGTISDVSKNSIGINMIGESIYNEINEITSCIDNATYGLVFDEFAFDNYVGKIITSGNGTAGIANGGLNNRIGQATISEGTKVAALFTSYHKPFASLGIGELGGAQGRWYKAQYYGVSSDQITGGQNEAWAYGGNGTCQYFNPNSTTEPMREEFYIPCTAGVGIQIHCQVRKTSAAADCVMQISMIGAGITPVYRSNISLTDSWAEYTSATMMPTITGFIKIVLEIYDGTTTGDIGIDDIHAAAV